MQINQINDNQTVSHKAYFKPNAEFKRLCNRGLQSVKPQQIETLLSRPNHELEILGRIIHRDATTFEVFNNTTKRLSNIILSKDKANLSGLIDKLCSNYGYFDSTSDDIVKFDKLTKPQK